MSVFKNISEERVLHRGEHFFIIADAFPVSPGHLLIISDVERKDYFSLSVEEKNSLPVMIDIAREIIFTTHQPSGFNIGMNCGEDAGQTVMYFHCHVIPRCKGDMKNPRGGIRQCVLGKGYY